MTAVFDPMGNYTGDDGVLDPAVAQVDASNVGWFRTKAAEFQQVMNAADSTMQALQTLLTLDISDEDWYTLNDYLNSFYAKRTRMKLTAEAFNTAAAAVNAFGGALPTVHVPSGLAGLGAIPAIPLAIGVAGLIAGVTYLIADVIGIITGSSSAALQAANAITDPGKRDAALSNVASIEAAKQSAVSTTLGAASSAVMWIAIAVGSWFVFQAIKQQKGK